MVTKPLWTRWFAVAAFGLLAGACADQSPTAIDNDALLSEGSASFSTAKTSSISGVEIYPGSYTLKLSEARQLVAVPVNVLGIATSLGGQLITWKSSNQAVATVSSRGVVSAVGGGRATISAHIGPIVGRAVITVQAPPRVASVAVTPSSKTVAVDEYVQLLATPRDASGTAVSGYAIQWRSSNPAVAKVFANGLVQTIAPGTVTISAISDGKTGKAQLTVARTVTADRPSSGTTVTLYPGAFNLSVGESRQVTALATDAAGKYLRDTPKWTSSNPNVATVSSTGHVIARAAGTVTITAQYPSGKGAVTVNVSKAY